MRQALIRTPPTAAPWKGPQSRSWARTAAAKVMSATMPAADEECVAMAEDAAFQQASCGPCPTLRNRT